MNRKMNLIIQVFAGCLILIMSACGPLDRPVPGPELVDTQWQLISYGEPDTETQVIEGTEVTLQFGEDGQAGGHGGCNTFGAQYEISNDQISFTEIVSTQIACPEEGVMDQEAAYFEALRSAETINLINDQLRIWYNGGQSVLNFVSLQ